MTREELLEAAERAIEDKSINIAAIKLLLEELRRDNEEGVSDDPLAAFDSNVKEFRRTG